MASKGFDISREARHLERLAPAVMRWSGVVAVVGLAGAAGVALAGEHGLDRLLQTYLVSFCYLLSISLGALFFVLLQHCTRAGWSVTSRRIAEAMAANVWLLAVLAIPLLAGISHLYHWAHADGDPLIAAKAGYLNPTFFTVRVVLYFAVWIALATFLFRTSTAQDESGAPALTTRMEQLSAPGMVLFALTVNFAAFDLLMSLDPHWFSTIFGVYFFAGSVVGFFALLPIVTRFLQRRGLLRHAITVDHYHDYGKLLFAFVVFWAYIAFSQYLLIWYGNIPEETEWFLKRQTGDWVWVSLALLLGHFVIPFLALISRFPKRRPGLLVIPAAWVAAMHWLDLYWLVLPEFSPATAPFGVVDVLCFAGLAGLFVLALAWRLGRHSLVPEKDPRLAESLAFENA